MLTTIFSSVDSFAISMALAVLGVSLSRQYRFCIALMLSDALGTFLGLSMHNAGIGIWAVKFTPLTACAYALLVIVIASRVRLLLSFGSLFALLISVILGLDNLLAGIAGDSWQTGAVFTASLAAAALSGLFALCGMAVAISIKRRLSYRLAYCTGIILLLFPFLLS